MRAITARFTDKPVKLDDAEERRGLRALKVVYYRVRHRLRSVIPKPTEWQHIGN
jgi:hypothetical protein